jgi:hypothetical protein
MNMDIEELKDRELLEQAAKAAGIKGHFLNQYIKEDDCGILTEVTKLDGCHDGWRVWNPLRDDADALRLALRLGMFLDMGTPGQMEAVVFVEDNTRRVYEIDPDIKRAIVKLAAALHAEEVKP